MCHKWRAPHRRQAHVQISLKRTTNPFPQVAFSKQTSAARPPNLFHPNNVFAHCAATMASPHGGGIAERPADQAMATFAAAATPAERHNSNAHGADDALDGTAPVLAESHGESKRKRDETADSERGGKTAKHSSGVHDEFMLWLDIQCVERWNELCSAAAWVDRFKKFYPSDETLQTILSSRKQHGFDIMERKLKEKVGNDGIGLVADEIVAKLEELLKQEKGCG